MHAAALRLPSIRAPRALVELFKFGTLIGALLAALSGCAGLNPIAIAQTPAQKYDAAVLTLDALLEPATQIVEDTTAPPGLRRTLQATIATAGDVYTSSQAAKADFDSAVTAFKTGVEGGQAKLDVATANLEKWTADLLTNAGRLEALTKK